VIQFQPYFMAHSDAKAGQDDGALSGAGALA
jgi:hypothetical protein